MNFENLWKKIVDEYFGFDGKVQKEPYFVRMLIVTILLFTIGIAVITIIPLLISAFSLTVRRLRDIGWPIATSVLLIVPLVNLIFAISLCFISSNAQIGVDPHGKSAEDIAKEFKEKLFKNK